MRIAQRIKLLEHVVRPDRRIEEANLLRRRIALLWKHHPEFIMENVDEFAYQLSVQGASAPQVKRMAAKINAFILRFDRKHGLDGGPAA